MYELNQEDIDNILIGMHVQEDGSVISYNIEPPVEEDNTEEESLEENSDGELEVDYEHNEEDTSEEILQFLNDVENQIEDRMEEVEPDIITTDVVEVRESTARFSGAVWFNEIQKSNIIIAGVGGIGSYVAFLLSRMQPESITLYDNDVVEEVNMAGQLYDINSIGRTKVFALARIMSSFSNFNRVNLKEELYTNESSRENIMICGFDNMDARKVFFNSWKNHVNSIPKENRKDCLFLDGRLAAEKFQVLAITGDDDYNIKRYKDEFLFSDEEAEETLCSYKQTTYMANMIGSVMVNLYTNFISNKAGSPIPRSLPFLTSFTGDFLMFNTEY